MVIANDGEIVVWGSRKNICRDLQSRAGAPMTSRVVGNIWYKEPMGRLSRFDIAAGTAAIDAVAMAVVGGLGTDEIPGRIFVLHGSNGLLAGIKRVAEEVSVYITDTNKFEEPLIERDIKVHHRVTR